MRKVPVSPPSVAAGSVAVTETTGPTLTLLAEAIQLLFSLFSSTKFVSSAQARRKYEPTAVLDGMVTVTPMPSFVPLIPNEGTERLPVKRISPLPLIASKEK
jgi:hypothetical protein